MNKYKAIASYFNIKALKKQRKIRKTEKIKIHVACIEIQLYNYAKKTKGLCKCMHK